ncbi:hypothetical protein B0H17DRAFT_462391 [Mycena rosella]|uniref:Uncharacterized protein n=1 Tax=Mycena rosella TaxID=1033263 RepID=A0AAD7DLN6_MYCRO|nr:hypothetical protein B0H17DRAFT_462391 [Mycena rosella]
MSKAVFVNRQSVDAARKAIHHADRTRLRLVLLIRRVLRCAERSILGVRDGAVDERVRHGVPAPVRVRGRVRPQIAAQREVKVAPRAPAARPPIRRNAPAPAAADLPHDVRDRLLRALPLAAVARAGGGDRGGRPQRRRGAGGPPRRRRRAERGVRAGLGGGEGRTWAWRRRGWRGRRAGRWVGSWGGVGGRFSRTRHRLVA